MLESRDIRLCVLAQLTKLVEMNDCDAGEINSASRLVDCVPASIDLVYLVGLIGKVLHDDELPDRFFFKLRTSNRMVTELCVEDVVNIVSDILADSSAGVGRPA
jgi:hypothetical protein